MSGENLEDSWGDFLELSTESRDRRKMWEKKAVDLHQAVRRAWLHVSTNHLEARMVHV